MTPAHVATLRRRIADSATGSARSSVQRLVPGANTIGVPVPRLRELCKQHRPSVVEFLQTHSARLAPKVIREVSAKLGSWHR